MRAWKVGMYGQSRPVWVVCGNLLNGDLDPSPAGIYASGADGTMIRSVLAYGVNRGWGMSLTDIRTAFLLAPRPIPTDTREVVVIPPRILVTAGVVGASERWRVLRALYGFASSPNRWAVHRDSTVKTFRWYDDHEKCELGMLQTLEGNLWRIGKVQADGSVTGCLGHLIVYVDDMLVVGPKNIRDSFMSRLQEEWRVSPPETVDDEHWARFCGFELRWDKDQLMVCQPSYVQDLLDRHGITTTRPSPMGKLEPPEELEPPIAETTKRAQGLTGELLWLAIRTRPDIAFAVSQIGRQVTKRPSWSLMVGKQVLEYLAGTKEVGLRYGGQCRLMVPTNN